MEKRISLSIKMPSVGLMNFIEKALQDDKFFEAAVENPLDVLKENGVRLNLNLFTPKDLATFFGALSGAKEMIKKQNIKDIRFENVFGQAAEIRGTRLMAETNRSMWTQFNKEALINREMFTSTKENFSSLKEKLADTSVFKDTSVLKDSSVLKDTSAFRDISTNFYEDIQVSMAGKTESHKSSDTGTTFHFDANKGVGSSKTSSIDTYKTQNFSGLGLDKSFIEDMLNGPLVNPVDLANIASQINTYVNIAEQM